jgi:hypothetical protein
MPDLEMQLQNSPRAIAAVDKVDGLIEHGRQTGATIEQMYQLFELRKQVDAEEARKAYFADFALFQEEDIAVIKDMENKQYSTAQKKAMYSSIGNLVGSVRPYLAKHGFGPSWAVVQEGNKIIVTCTLKHRGGHSESVTMEGTPDGSGAKNPLQQVKSTRTYLRVCTFEDICGIASSEANLNDDGNGAGKGEQMEETTYVGELDKIKDANDKAELRKLFSAACELADAAKDSRAKDDFIKAKNTRYRELDKEGK